MQNETTKQMGKKYFRNTIIYVYIVVVNEGERGEDKQRAKLREL
jgi:hypothetical protein